MRIALEISRSFFKQEAENHRGATSDQIPFLSISQQLASLEIFLDRVQTFLHEDSLKVNSVTIKAAIKARLKFPR